MRTVTVSSYTDEERQQRWSLLFNQMPLTPEIAGKEGEEHVRAYAADLFASLLPPKRLMEWNGDLSTDLCILMEGAPA